MANKFLTDKTKKRVKRNFRRQRQRVEGLGQQADQNIDKLLLRRFNRLALVRRFVSLWLIFVGLLIVAGVTQLRDLSSYYQSLQPVPGGVYSEGIVGLFANANPLYANGAADTSVSHLVFSGLFKYDSNRHLVGDLATSWQLDSNQTTYTVLLRHNVKWQDGTEFTSDDVVFTYQTIQNTEAQSPLFSSWQGITVSASGAYKVVFKLPDPLASFPNSLTNGIIPEHLLGKIPAGQLRSASFDSAPVGTGPFQLRFISVTGNSDVNLRQEITFAPYKNYWAGKPKLDGFNLSVFRTDQQMINAFKRKQISSMSGLDSIPVDLSSSQDLQFYNTPLNAIVMAFYNNSQPILKDKLVRQALTSAVDRSQLVSLMSYPPNLVNGPLLPSQATYTKTNTQLPYNLGRARQLLDQAGWKKGAGNLLYKDGKVLSVNLASQNTEDYVTVSQFLQQQWAKLGVKVNVTNSSVEDLQGNTIPNHDYDILLYGINVGVDPDEFAYWDSSQASTNSQGHLNLSEYKSTVADQALESARTRQSSKLRVPKYQEFLKIWSQDAPALALYQPTYLYISRGPVFGFQRTAMDTAADRYYNVGNWMIRQQLK